MMVITMSTALMMIAATAHRFEYPAFLLCTSATIPRVTAAIWTRKKETKNDMMNATMPIVLPGKVEGIGGAPDGPGRAVAPPPCGANAAGSVPGTTSLMFRPPSHHVRAGVRLADEAVVFGMRTNPEPRDSIIGLRSESTVRKPHPNRPESPDFLEVKRRMSRIRLQKLEVPPGKTLNRFG